MLAVLILISLMMVGIVTVAARRKGFMAPLWFLYALIFWPAAFIHVLLAPPKPKG